MTLLANAQANKTVGVNSHETVANLYSQREAANKQLSEQRKAKRASAAGTGLSTGLMVGMAAGGPAGWAVGIGVALAGMML